MAAMREPLRLGVIGMSPGNGHPYSWSAIFNGYNQNAMSECPFPAIPAYLEKQNFPDMRLDCGIVTHVWCDDRAVSQHIADACLIPNIADSLLDIAAATDAILLARDDAELHVDMALPFLTQGLPVYIDKPFALSIRDSELMLDAEQFPGQLFTGTALIFAAEFQLDDTARAALGPIRKIVAETPKTWRAYAPHIVEPVLSILQSCGSPLITSVSGDGESCMVNLKWEDGAEAELTATGKNEGQIKIRIEAERETRTLIFEDSFTCFRAALESFCQGVMHKERRFDLDLMRDAVAIYEAGMNPCHQ